MFKNRADAARQLAKALASFRGQDPIILAIPRGGVPIGHIVAKELQAELDLIHVRKIAAPFSTETAIGAVDSFGRIYAPDSRTTIHVDEDYLASQQQDQLRVMEKRQAAYGDILPRADLRERVVIVVDDGLATGITMACALCAVRASTPSYLVCAIPVAPREALSRVAPYADQVVCLKTPEDFFSVSENYWLFPQVDDEEVRGILKKHRKLLDRRLQSMHERKIGRHNQHHAQTDR